MTSVYTPKLDISAAAVTVRLSARAIPSTGLMPLMLTIRMMISPKR